MPLQESEIVHRTIIAHAVYEVFRAMRALRRLSNPDQSDASQVAMKLNHSLRMNAGTFFGRGKKMPIWVQEITAVPDPTQLNGFLFIITWEGEYKHVIDAEVKVQQFYPGRMEDDEKPDAKSYETMLAEWQKSKQQSK